jgi:hypothetical protein
MRRSTKLGSAYSGFAPWCTFCTADEGGEAVVVVGGENHWTMRTSHCLSHWLHHLVRRSGHGHHLCLAGSGRHRTR